MTQLAGPVLNSTEAAAYCGLSGGGQSMRNLKYRGVGPESHRVRRALVFYPADLDKWIANGGSAHGAEAKSESPRMDSGRLKTEKELETYV